jgi:hypothetical protein
MAKAGSGCPSYHVPNNRAGDRRTRCLGPRGGSAMHGRSGGRRRLPRSSSQARLSRKAPASGSLVTALRSLIAIVARVVAGRRSDCASEALVAGPGRSVIFATGQHVEPWMSVYPDSDKVSGPEGILLRSSAVGYWHGEGTASPSEPVEVAREPERTPPRPVVNAPAIHGEAAAPHAAARSRYRASELGALVGAARLGGSVVELDPERDPSPTTTSSVRRSGCWSWPVRPRCATRRARHGSMPAISCASMKARPVRTGWSMVGSQSCERSSCRRRACRPLCVIRTPGTGCFGTAAMTSSSASPADRSDGPPRELTADLMC